MLLLALALQVLPPAPEDPSAAPLETFKAAYRTKDPSARASAVDALAATQHDKVYAKLGSLLTVDVPEVRIAAARGLAGCKAEKKTKPMAYLMAATAPNAKDPGVLAALLEALGKLKQEAALPEVERHLRSKQIPVAQAAIQAVVEIRSARSVPGLIALLKWLEDQAKEAPDLQGGGPNVSGVGGGGVQDRDASERQRTLSPAVDKALQAITGAAMTGRQAWEDWYRETGGRVRPSK
jgi:HEAT repeat protein